MRGQILQALRKLRLINMVDRIRYFVEKYKNRKINNDFIKNHPEVVLPPDYLIYESFQMNYTKYYSESRDTAKWMVNYFKKYIDLKNKKILDWGCGPGRLIRHLPSIISNGCEYFGTDYNKRSIDWCSNNLPDIHFHCNSLEAKLPYSDNFFDVIYGISIFTHLSEQLHYDWRKELYRILKPEGIMFLTTQGKNFRIKLTKEELSKFDHGELIVRGNVKEGHRTFSAFHPKKFMERLFDHVEILEHLEFLPEEGRGLPQDVWILKK